MQLEGRVAIVTGAGGGIGQATCNLLAKHGARVVASDLVLEAANVTAEQIRLQGGAALAVKADLAVEDDTVALINRTIDEFGRLDILHNNAADLAPDVSPPHDSDVENTERYVWERCLGVNVLGTAMMCKHAIPEMVRTGGGSIINTGSNLALQGNIIQVAYSASKAAVLQLTRSIAASHGRRNIRCNAVLPGLTMTPAVRANIPTEHIDAALAETLLPYLGEAEDIANAVLFLAGDTARSITGQNIVVDGGTWTHVPGFERMTKAWFT